ncbi:MULTISPECIES: dihydrofolate reductase family protein [unclassified Streptomyces]|uniref:dihydrofolate reductase family protein n=1 Tax=unclassified Streptomyces TaxID=2593676 RepID=UPI002E2E31C6|nr:dihydrofolate reductase family protein [Streptomyces sp. NBC_00223]
MARLSVLTQISADHYLAGADVAAAGRLWNWSDSWMWDDDLKAYAGDLLARSHRLLLGRRAAEEGYLRHLERQVGAHAGDTHFEFARPVTRATKIVVDGGTGDGGLPRPGRDDISHAVRAAGADAPEDESLLAFGDAPLLAALLAAGLVDELLLLVDPVALGDGVRWPRRDHGSLAGRRVGERTFPCGVLVVRYAPGHTRPAPTPGP